MQQNQLLEIIKAVGMEQSRIVLYTKSLQDKLNNMKENAKETLEESTLYKINPSTGTNPYYRLSFKLGETKLLLQEYQNCFRTLTNAFENGKTNIDLNNPIITSSCKHFLNENGIFDNAIYPDDEIISSVQYQIFPYTSTFANNMKLIYYYVLENFVEPQNLEIDVQGIYKELEQNEEIYNENEVKEIKNATVQLANLFARRKNSQQIKVEDILNEFDFLKYENGQNTTERRI